MTVAIVGTVRPESAATEKSTPASVTLREAAPVWARIASLSFGGPAGQIAVMHRILVEERRWISENRFLHALNFCTLLPGPEAQQLATYVGWLMHGTRGGLVAGGLFVLPGVVAIMALSWVYALYGNVGLVAGLFFGLKAAVLAIVAQAVLRIGRRALKSQAMVALAAASFVAIFFLDVPFPVIVLTAGAIGYAGGKAGLPQFRIGGGHGASGKADAGPYLLGDDELLREHASLGHTLRVLAVWAALWLLPVAVVLAIVGPDDVFAQVAVFFSKMAMVTFGGAYAVLAYVAQQAVEHYGWLRPGEMLDGLGHGRDHARPADHGHPVRGLHGGVPEPRRPAAAPRRDARGPAHHMGDLRAVLPLDLRRRPLRRAPARQPRRWPAPSPPSPRRWSA